MLAPDRSVNVAKASESVATMGKINTARIFGFNHRIVRATVLRAHAVRLAQKTLELLNSLVSKGFLNASLNFH